CRPDPSRRRGLSPAPCLRLPAAAWILRGRLTGAAQSPILADPGPPGRGNRPNGAAGGDGRSTLIADCEFRIADLRRSPRARSRKPRSGESVPGRWGDLRSPPRRGQETRAEREATRAERKFPAA